MLGLSAESVWRIAQAVIQLERERCQALVLVDIGLDHFTTNLDQLRRDPRRRLTESCEHDGCKLLTFLGFGNSLVFVIVQRRVDIDTADRFVRVGYQSIGLIKVIGTFAQRAAAVRRRFPSALPVAVR